MEEEMKVERELVIKTEIPLGSFDSRETSKPREGVRRYLRGRCQKTKFAL